MSLLDDVSIVVTPNGYKAGELYAVVPVPVEGAELVTNGDFASDLTGWTGYGTTSATGGVATIGASANSGILQTILTEEVRYNVSVNVTSYNGVGTAQFTNNDGTNIYTITSTGIQTFTFIHSTANANLILRGMSNALFSVSSVSVKEYTAADMDVTRATAATRVDEAGLVNYAEIIGSELVTNGDFATDSDWSLGSGWSIANQKATRNSTGTYTNITQGGILTVGKNYKVKFTVNEGSIGGVRLQLGGTYYGDYNGVGTYTIYGVSGATAFNNFSLVGEPTFNGSIDNVSVKEATRDNVPRIDYTGGGCPHILAEPQRTNLITFSNDFSNAIWQKQTGIVPTYNTTETLSPDGTNNATKFIGTGSTGVFKSGVSVSGSISRSVYLKSVSGTTTAKFKDPNATGSATPVNLTITNKWQRFELIGDNGTSSQGLWIDDITSDGLYMWGAQLESGSFPTSYIPTSGSTVTRNQDIFTRDGIGSLINSEEGVLFVELSALANDGLSKRITLADGSISNRVSLELDEIANKIKAFISKGGTSQILEYTTPNLLQFNKIAIKWKVNDFAIWFNGNEVATDSSGDVPTGVNELSFNDGQGGNNFFGKVKQLQVYKTALTDAQLTSLTS